MQSAVDAAPRWLLVFVGGAIGTLARHGVGVAVGDTVPVRTLIVNLVGTFLLGMLVSVRLSERMGLLVRTGVLGAFTTFASLTVESVVLGTLGAVNLVVTIVVGVVLARLGIGVGRGLFQTASPTGQAGR